ncbi:MAG TPA: OmpA family protein [Spirochaetota bacterium]|nr:OmpA family protein [Spirochaetota bacterium]HOD14346.1 OmpA family protein [Spirochaetota bacterium]HPG50776.1 OmpA family protein [Spirochaetota bacterium]HPN12428.1 OmpA family protein [Spirochaetota bacterium]
MKIAHMALAALLAAAAPHLEADDGGGGTRLKYRYAPGEKYRIVTEISEDVFINGTRSHSSDILNKISVDTAEVKNGSGRLDCFFRMSERIQGRYEAFFLKEDYHSVFWRDERGAFTIDQGYFMPVVRNVPLFPTGAVRPGDAWSAAAEEVHDLRRGYGVERPLHFPVRVQYSYLRNEVREGVNTAVLMIEYNTFHRVPAAAPSSRPMPDKITGTSVQTWYWDIAAGTMHSYEEEFDFIFFLNNGSNVEYRGTARGSLIRSQPLDRDSVADELNNKLKEEKLDDVTVKKDRNGVSIVLENVQFPPNSPELTDAEKSKLARIASILRKFPGRDFLVTGHTARIGDEETSRKLSVRRAQAVGDFLVGTGGIGKTRVMTRGMGSGEPVGDNATEEGRRRNRRVEIMILEN